MSSTKRKDHRSKIIDQRSKTLFKINSLSNLLIFIGLCFLVAGAVIPLFTFYPVIREEIKYKITPRNLKKATEIIPVDKDFGIVIPKINANSKIIINVNPYRQDLYQKALTRGVAHAEGTSLPGEIGNIFLFAHSSSDWYTANRYNSVFYLLTKLEKNDEIDLYYQKQKFVYKVIEKKIVEAADIDYLTRKTAKKTVTLMTCWPPGTTLKRLIIIADLVHKN